MCSTLIRLKPIETRPALSAFACSVRVSCAPRLLMLRYTLHGPLRQLVIPAAADRPEHTAGLWRTTCMECFLRPANSSAYTEWNFSPSGNWWTSGFESYRAADRHQPEGRKPLRIRTHRAADRLILLAALPLEHAGLLHVDPALILDHTADGQRSHWAIAHPFEHPDFHRPSGMGPAVQGFAD